MRPTLDFEQALLKQGYLSIAGTDEAGRGSIFGPVCVGLVILPLDNDPERLLETLDEVRDSKQLLRTRVYELSDVVKGTARAWAVGEATASEVDERGIVGGIRLALLRAYHTIEAQIDYVVADYSLPANVLEFPYQNIKKGDAQCLSIACAAILAKHQHDLRVRELALDYPDDYGLDRNVGYGTPSHIEAIRQLGPTPHHRHSFKPILQPRLFD
jgi:ribonuclease HII